MAIFFSKALQGVRLQVAICCKREKKILFWKIKANMFECFFRKLVKDKELIIYGVNSVLYLDNYYYSIIFTLADELNGKIYNECFVYGTDSRADYDETKSQFSVGKKVRVMGSFRWGRLRVQKMRLVSNNGKISQEEKNKIISEWIDERLAYFKSIGIDIIKESGGAVGAFLWCGTEADVTEEEKEWARAALEEYKKRKKQ